ncbi:hypothetical protein Tco_0595765 [Tanacetum coccineum]
MEYYIHLFEYALVVPAADRDEYSGFPIGGRFGHPTPLRSDVQGCQLWKPPRIKTQQALVLQETRGATSDVGSREQVIRGCVMSVYRGSTSTEEENPGCATHALIAKGECPRLSPMSRLIEIPLRRGSCLWRSLIWITAQQAALVAQLRARFASEHGQSVQKDEEILLLKTHVADARLRPRCLQVYAQKLAEEKNGTCLQVEHQERGILRIQGKFVIGYEVFRCGVRSTILLGLDEFRQERWEELLEKQEEGEVIAILVLRVKQSFGDVVKVCIGCRVPGYNDNAYGCYVDAIETMKLLELPHITQRGGDRITPIDV